MIINYHCSHYDHHYYIASNLDAIYIYTSQWRARISSSNSKKKKKKPQLWVKSRSTLSLRPYWYQKRGAMAISICSSSAGIVGWCRPRRRSRRRRGSTIRLGNRRRGFCIGSRVVVGPFRMLKRLIMELAPNEKLIEAYYSLIPFLRPTLFPLSWWNEWRNEAFSFGWWLLFFSLNLYVFFVQFLVLCNEGKS